jgi:hypothetical protein
MFLHFLVLDYENYYPKGKKEVPKGDGSKKSESKRKLLCSLFFCSLQGPRLSCCCLETCVFQCAR